MPTVSVVVERDAVPLLRLTVPNVADPFLNVTVPVGIPPEVEFTVAINATFCPNADGLTPELIVVVVAGLLTVSTNTADVLDKNVASPE